MPHVSDTIERIDEEGSPGGSGKTRYSFLGGSCPRGAIFIRAVFATSSVPLVKVGVLNCSSTESELLRARRKTERF